MFYFLVVKKDDSDVGSLDTEDYRPLYELSQAMNDMQNGMMDYSSQGYATKAALVAAARDLESNANVTSTLHIDSSYIYITMGSGLQAVYFLAPVDGNGDPIFRGSGSASAGGMLKMLSADCTNEITNKKILLFNADFTTDYNARQVLKENKDKYSLEVKEFYKEQCTYDVVAAFGDYGLVVLNTHGLPNGFLLGTELPVTIQNSVSDLDAFAEALNNSASRNIADQILIDKQIGVAVVKHYDPNMPIHQQIFKNADTMATYISAKQIAQFNYSNTIIMGNMCFSGFDNTTFLDASNLPILSGFRQAGTRTYFGYQQSAGVSTPVFSDFAEEMELRLYQGFYDNGDSTGSVHLDMTGVESFDPDFKRIQSYGNLFFRQFFAEDYCYDQPCADTMVEGTDGKVYKTVCIGDQVWMAENLNDVRAGVCYDNDPNNCETYGRLYSIM